MKHRHRTFFYRIVTIVILVVFLVSIIGMGLAFIFE